MKLLLALILASAIGLVGVTVGFRLFADRVTQSVIDQSVSCTKAHDAWVASGSVRPFTDPCTGLVLQPLPTYQLWSFPVSASPLFPGWSP